MNATTPIFALGSYVSAISMRVARLPLPGESLSGEAIVLEAGGKGLNVAIATRRLGAAVDGLIAVGDDPLGAMAPVALAAAGLPDAMLVRCPGPSGTGVGLIGPDGENMIAVYPGANALLSAAHVAAARARIAAAESVVAQFEIGDAPIAAAFALARATGALTFLNPSPYRPIAPDILASTDIVVVNVTEAAALLADLGGGPADRAALIGAAGDDLARRLFDRDVMTLVVTLGCDGARVWRRGEAPIDQPAFPIRAEDCTGCGDAFLAGLVVGLGEGSGWPDALRLAAACGAMTAARTGVLDALPMRAEVERWLLEVAADPVG